MSRDQSLTDRVRDPEERRRMLQDAQQYERRNRQPLIAGAAAGLLLGLLVGLFIGWFVWPVQWTNAWPSDMADEAKADYIVAVADVYAAAPSQDAARLASEQLRWFEPDIAAELAAAQQYLVDNWPNEGNPHIANIDQLIATLALVSAANSSQQPPEEMATPPTVVAPTVVAPADVEADQVLPVESGLPDWLRLALWLLTAFVLIAGGIWVLRTVMRTPADGNAKRQDDAVDEFEEHDFVQPTGAADPFAEDSASLSASAAHASGDQREDAEPADAQAAGDFADGGDSQDGGGNRQNISVMSGSAGAVITLSPQDDPDGYGFAPEPEAAYPMGSVSTTIIQDVSSEDEPHEAQSADEENALPDAIEDDQADESEVAPVAAMPLDDEPNEREPEIAAFTAHFQPGLDGYEEAFRIEGEGQYFGDCGMGVNIKHGLVGQNPEHVAVLDVWIVDQAENADVSFQSMSLVSKYGVATKLEQQLTEGEKPQRTLSAPRSRETFQLAGKNLLADCEIVSVNYVALGQVEGVFSECKVNIVVRRRS